MMRKILVAMVLVCLTFPAAAAVPAPTPAPAYTLVKEKSSLKFYAIQNSAPIEGTFNDFTTEIRFDPEHPDNSSIKAAVSTGSVAVTHDDVQKSITLPEWLSTAAFPKAMFTSRKITRTPRTDDYYVEGDLELKGKTVPIVLNFNLQQTGDVAVAKGYATIQRKDFGIGQGEWAKDDVIKDAVRVEFRIYATQSK